MGLPGFDAHPLGCPVGLRVTPQDMPDIIPSVLRITVTRVPPDRNRPDRLVVRVYSLVDEKVPRLLLFPGWKSTDESGLELDRSDLEELLARIIDQRLPEIPVEALFE